MIRLKFMEMKFIANYCIKKFKQYLLFNNESIYCEIKMSKFCEMNSF